jgi:hypothetical protein
MSLFSVWPPTVCPDHVTYNCTFVFCSWPSLLLHYFKFFVTLVLIFPYLLSWSSVLFFPSSFRVFYSIPFIFYSIPWSLHLMCLLFYGFISSYVIITPDSVFYYIVFISVIVTPESIFRYILSSSSISFYPSPDLVFYPILYLPHDLFLLCSFIFMW